MNSTEEMAPENLEDNMAVTANDSQWLQLDGERIFQLTTNYRLMNMAMG